MTDASVEWRHATTRAVRQFGSVVWNRSRSEWREGKTWGWVLM